MSVPMYAVFFAVGILLFAIGMIMWSGYRRNWVDSVGLGLAAGGLVLLVSAIAMSGSKP